MADVLESLILDELYPTGPHRWCLPALVHRRLEARLRAEFEDPFLPSEAVLRMLKLLAVFEEEAAYEGVAEPIIAMLRRIPAAVLRIEALQGRSPRTEAVGAELCRFEARKSTRRAPMHDGGTVLGLRARDLRRPIDPIEMRVRSSSRAPR